MNVASEKEKFNDFDKRSSEEREKYFSAEQLNRETNGQKSLIEWKEEKSRIYNQINNNEITAENSPCDFYSYGFLQTDEETQKRILFFVNNF